MKEVLYLAWRYLSYHRVKTVILTTSITLILFLPVGLRVLANQGRSELIARARVTPLLLGGKGSPLELTLNSLYFESDVPDAMRYGEIARVDSSGLARPIPLYTRFRCRGFPVVGTTLDYFECRGLRLSKGRTLALLGECVLGAEAARKLGVSIGDPVVSSTENVFDLAGVYPLKMSVVGILRRSYTPDDRAIFTDLKTTWVIAGIGHGHQDLSQPGAGSQILKKEGNTVIANSSVKQYNEVTRENLASFHFHGKPEDFPVTAAIIFPKDEKASTLLRGRYLSPQERVQLVSPVEVMNGLLATIFTLQSYLIAAVLVIGLATLATAILVFMLSLRLRRREIATMMKIGGSRGRVFAVLVSEIAMVLAVSVLLATGLTLVTAHFGSAIIRSLILS
jgi:putative ABC transport system permease protein